MARCICVPFIIFDLNVLLKFLKSVIILSKPQFKYIIEKILIMDMFFCSALGRCLGGGGGLLQGVCQGRRGRPRDPARHQG